MPVMRFLLFCGGCVMGLLTPARADSPAEAAPPEAGDRAAESRFDLAFVRMGLKFQGGGMPDVPRGLINDGGEPKSEGNSQP